MTKIKFELSSIEHQIFIPAPAAAEMWWHLVCCGFKSEGFDISGIICTHNIQVNEVLISTYWHKLILYVILIIHKQHSNLCKLQQLLSIVGGEPPGPEQPAIHCLESVTPRQPDKPPLWVIDSRHFFCLGVKTSPRDFFISHEKSCQQVQVGAFLGYPHSSVCPTVTNWKGLISLACNGQALDLPS